MDDRHDLEDKARAGRQQREANEKLQAEANGRAEHEKLSDGDRKQSRREEAELWRFAQRASVAFDRMVNVQIASMFLFMSVLAWCFVGITEDRHALIRLGIVVAIGAVWFPVFTMVSRAKHRAILRDERNWALRNAFGMTGHMRAIGQTKNDKAGLALIVELAKRMPEADEALFSDALATIGRSGRMECEGKTVTIHSREMPTKQLIGWCRDVVGQILPKMGTYGIARVSMECEGGGFITDFD